MSLAQLSLSSHLHSIGRINEQLVFQRFICRSSIPFPCLKVDKGGVRKRGKRKANLNQFGEGRLENGGRSQSPSRSTEKYVGRPKAAHPHPALSEGPVFRIKRSTQLKKLLIAYCDKKSVELDNMRFVHNGRLVRPNLTPDEHEMESGDVIYAFPVLLG